MPDAPTLAAAWLLGLMGSAHCLGMCGGIGAALGLADARRSSLFALSYHRGRILGYAALGALAGGAVALLGAGLRELLPTVGLWLRAIAGLLVVAMGLYVGGW
jgi:sulfite exporter TauE/SafE